MSQEEARWAQRRPNGPDCLTEEQVTAVDATVPHMRDKIGEFLDETVKSSIAAHNGADATAKPVGSTPSVDGGGLRFNSGKLRYDLVPAFAQEQYVSVLTKGSLKYLPRNWERGMKWSSVLASLERHLAAIKKGEDTDPESGLLHSAHIMCNAAFLTEYYRIYPQGDDRPHAYLSQPRIGLDIDEVLADWVRHWTAHHKQPIPEFWSFDRDIAPKFAEMKNNKEFWMSIPVLTKPQDLPFEPVCYVTSRVIPSEWTAEWLDRNGFPAVPVHTVGHGMSKIEVLRNANVEVFVDDRYENFVEINRAGILCYLFDAPHNRRYDVGYRRIKELKELKR